MRSEAKRLRLEELLDLKDIANLLGVHESTVCRWLKADPFTPEEQEIYSKAVQAKHPVPTEKICCMCGAKKPLEEYNKNKGRKDGLQSRCRPCDKKRSIKLYYARGEVGRKKIYANKEARRWERRAWIFEYLLCHPCVDCGEKDPIVLEFDHRDPSKKKGNMAQLVSEASLKKVKQEVKKCDVRCANCHRTKTALERGFWVVSEDFLRRNPHYRPKR